MSIFSGGGLPVGSICLIGQDTYNSFTDIVTRCFLAEGIVHKHALFVADLTESKEHLLKVPRPTLGHIFTKPLNSSI